MIENETAVVGVKSVREPYRLQSCSDAWASSSLAAWVHLPVAFPHQQQFLLCDGFWRGRVSTSRQTQSKPDVRDNTRSPLETLQGETQTGHLSLLGRIVKLGLIASSDRVYALLRAC